MLNIHDRKRNEYMLHGGFAVKGYDWWWHSLTAVNEKTGEEKPFFIEYFLCNPALGGKKPVFGQIKDADGHHRRPSYLMVKAGTWGKEKAQLHRFFGWDDVSVTKKGDYCVLADDCYADDSFIKGSVDITEEDAERHPEWMCDAGHMKWNLTIDKQVAFNVGYGADHVFRNIEAFEMYWHAEGMKSRYSGEIEYNGEKYIVTPETSYGYADKNWGRDFTSPWVWLSSDCMTSRITGKKLENSVFDIGGGRPKVYFKAMERKLLGAFWYEGAEYEYNFSKIWMKPETYFNCHETDTEIVWHVIQENSESVMITDVTCRKEDMLLVNYESPDGEKRHNRLWNGGNGKGRIRLYKKRGGERILIDDIDVTHIGCEYGEYC